MQDKCELVKIKTCDFNKMLKKTLIFFLCVLQFLFLTPITVLAVTDPLSVPNNRYGIHIIDENDLNTAARLVNSTGGDWGYVTLVITEKDRKLSKWQSIFDRMRELHLIPIVRLATDLDGDSWKRPHVIDAQPWTNFLSQLNWVTQNRYVILFNEPNHAKEWGSDINPEEYSDLVSTFSATLKGSSDDYFIMMAGFDASAPNGTITMDEITYLKRMINHNPAIFADIDGWSSHSYPNPGFAGSVYATGRGSLKTYEWEINQLNRLGVSKILPVFITETGWLHSEGIYFNKNYYSASRIADFIDIAAKTVWNDEKIVAITPFILNYQAYPFDHFSWVKPDDQEFYPQFLVYQSINKVAGQPVLVIPSISPASSILGIESNKVEPGIKESTNILASIYHRLAIAISMIYNSIMVAVAQR